MRLTLIPDSVYLTPAFSRPRSVLGAEPVARTAQSMRMVFSSFLSLKVTLVAVEPSGSRAMTSAPVITIMPKRLVKYSASAAPASLSSRGSKRFSRSRMMTLEPSSAKYSAISQPEAPPPTTRMNLGMRLALMMLYGVKNLAVSIP